MRAEHSRGNECEMSHSLPHPCIDRTYCLALARDTAAASARYEQLAASLRGCLYSVSRAIWRGALVAQTLPTLSALNAEGSRTSTLPSSSGRKVPAGTRSS